MTALEIQTVLKDLLNGQWKLETGNWKLEIGRTRVSGKVYTENKIL